MLKYHTGVNPWQCFEKNPKGEIHHIANEFITEKNEVTSDLNHGTLQEKGVNHLDERSSTGQQSRGIIEDKDTSIISSPTKEVPYESNEEVFSFDLPNLSVFGLAWKRHNDLIRLMELQNVPDLKQLFLTIASFCDPLTQPMESDKHIYSIDLISELVVSLNVHVTSQKGYKFELALNVFQIIEHCLVLLNCNDEIKLRGFNNSDLKVDWRLKLHEWTPLKFLKQQDIILLYQIVVICIYTLYKLSDTKDLCLNPFLQQLLKFWKIFTNVLLLSLEIDRRIESENSHNSIEKTPDLVKVVIRGSSSIRYVLAAMLNDDIENRYHDLHHVNIVDFMSPFARRNGNGCLVADVRWYIGSMLALSYELNEVVEILIDLEPNDKYDEDVRYIFDYEFDDFCHDFLEEELQEFNENGYIIYQDEEDNMHRIVPQRCTCTFPPEPEEDEDDFDDQVIEDMDEEEEEEDDDDRPVKAIRSDSIEYDEWGRDWRDIPRETNVEFNTALNLESKDIFTWDQLAPIFNEMTERPINDKTGKKIVFTIAKSIKNSDEGIIEKIYEFFQYDSNFELMINLNPELCYSMLDELFMTKGFRRVLIWFLTHLRTSQSLINYIYQILTELRGAKSKKFPFSRKGPLKLSEIEKSMLLHEFFNNTIIQLNNNGQHGSNEKLLKFTCMMIKNLINKNIIDLSEYKFEISNLLINYIGYIPEAKEIFFQINHKDDGNQDHESIIEKYKDYQKQQQQQLSTTDSGKKNSHDNVTSKFKKFNPALRNNLNNILNVFDNGETESLIFQPFLELIRSQPTDSSLVKEEESEEDEVKFVRGVILPSFRKISEEKAHELLEQFNAEDTN